MKQPVRYVLRILLRLLILWVVDAVAMFVNLADTRKRLARKLSGACSDDSP